LEQIAQYLPAFNISQFGGRLAPGGGWGGLGTAVVHVELNAWSKGRAVDTGNYQYYAFRIPAGWLDAGSFVGTIPGTTNVTTYWAYLPFMPFVTDSNGAFIRPYQASDHITNHSSLSATDAPDPANYYGANAGDYVRMVGLLWEDEPHTYDNYGDWTCHEGCCSAGCNSNDALPAKNCWNSNRYGSTRGWAEIHSVDFMTRLTPPGDPHLVAAYAICISGGSSLAFR